VQLDLEDCHETIADNRGRNTAGLTTSFGGAVEAPAPITPLKIPRLLKSHYGATGLPKRSNP
jgi:hypothetical protein